MKLKNLLLSCAEISAAAANIDFPSTLRTSPIEGDKASVLYPSSSRSSPILIGNGGSAGTGGIRTWSLSTPTKQQWDKRTGRTKLVDTVYGVGGRDWVVTMSQEDSNLRVFDAVGGAEGASRKVWSDYSALCQWTGEQGAYLYLFGKKKAVVLVVREKGNGVEIVEVCLAKKKRRELLLTGE